MEADLVSLATTVADLQNKVALLSSLPLDDLVSLSSRVEKLEKFQAKGSPPHSNIFRANLPNANNASAVVKGNALSGFNNQAATVSSNGGRPLRVVMPPLISSDFQL